MTLKTQNEEKALKAAGCSSQSARRNIFQVLKDHNYQPRILYSARLSFISDIGIKTFHDKNELKEFLTTKPVPQRKQEGVCQTKEGYKDK